MGDRKRQLGSADVHRALVKFPSTIFLRQRSRSLLASRPSGPGPQLLQGWLVRKEGWTVERYLKNNSVLWEDPTATKGVSAIRAVVPLQHQSLGARRALLAALEPRETHQEPLPWSAAGELLLLSNTTGRAWQENQAKDKPSHVQHLEFSFHKSTATEVR